VDATRSFAVHLSGHAMHITILTLGSRGDVVPYLALGQGLHGAGHEVRVISFQDVEPMARARGLDFAPIGGGMRLLLSGGSGLRMAEAGSSVVRLSLALLGMFRHLAQGFADDLSSPRLRETDLIVNQLPGALFGYDMAEAAGLPQVMAAVMPLTPTRHEPMLAFPQWPARFPGYNLITHWVAYQIAWGMFRSTISKWRSEVLSLSKPPFWGLWRRLQDESIPVINGYSPHLAPPAPDWGPHIHTTGAWFVDESDWTPPVDLVRFIQAGSPPVFVGFGSMPSRHPGHATEIVLKALGVTGLRAVVQAGWGGLEADQLPSHVYPVDVVPYDWLFRQVAAVVHHGGSGTTHAGLRAGRPSVLVPFVFDQFYWGRRVEALGAGPRPIPRRNLTARNLAAALDQAVHDSEIGRRAGTLGTRMQAERGVSAAVERLQQPLS
jgi:sterol 3beta-glucosyltransferase